MRRTAILFVISIFLCIGAFASDSQRQVSSGEITSKTTLKASEGKVYGVSMVATSNNAWVAIFDSNSGDNTGKTKLIELSEATQYNSSTIQFPEGLNAYEGIRVEISNASAIVYYY
jgi:hypothetical protein